LGLAAPYIPPREILVKSAKVGRVFSSTTAKRTEPLTKSKSTVAKTASLDEKTSDNLADRKLGAVIAFPHPAKRDRI
jgi:hypothetical protein